MNTAVCQELDNIYNDMSNMDKYVKHMSAEYSKVYKPIEELVVDLYNNIHDLKRKGKVYSAVYTDVQQIILNYQVDTKKMQLIYDDITGVLHTACKNGCSYVPKPEVLWPHKGSSGKCKDNKDNIKTNLDDIFKAVDNIKSVTSASGVIDNVLNSTGVLDRVTTMKDCSAKYDPICWPILPNIILSISVLDQISGVYFNSWFSPYLHFLNFSLWGKLCRVLMQWSQCLKQF